MSAASTNVLAIIGSKTDAANEQGILEYIVHRGATYKRLDTTDDFVEMLDDLESIGLASIGLSEKELREVILVSAASRDQVILAWEEWEKLQRIKNPAENQSNARPQPIDEIVEALLTRVNTFTTEALQNGDDSGNTKKEKIGKMIAERFAAKDLINISADESDKRAAILLTRFLVEKCGICRHIDLVNAIIVAKLVKDRRLPFGQVRQFRSGNHAVMTYIQNGKIWVLDGGSPVFFHVPREDLPTRIPIYRGAPIPKKDENVLKALPFKWAYGEKFYDEMLVRLNPPPLSDGPATTAATGTHFQWEATELDGSRVIVFLQQRERLLFKNETLLQYGLLGDLVPQNVLGLLQRSQLNEEENRQRGIKPG